MSNMVNNIKITCGCEENVIDIESDASTMTCNSLSSSGTKRERNHVFKMPYFKPGNVLKKKPRKSNILEIMSEQRTGNNSDLVFNSNVIAFKTNKLKSTNFYNTVHPEMRVSDCEYIRSGYDGRSILGVWRGDQFDTILYQLVLNLAPRGSSTEDDSPSFLKSIERVGPYFSKSHIEDICDTNSRNRKYVIYVGSYGNEDRAYQSSAVLCSFSNLMPTSGKQYVSVRELFCCGGSQNGDVFATGSSEGVFIYQDQDFLYHNPSLGRVNSIEFNSSGNILYCGTEHSKLIVLDRREAPWNNSLVQIMNYTSGISETKLFSNEYNMIVSGFDGSLSQIDLRKKGIVLSYPGHIVTNKKIPFSFSEHADLLCVTGSDKLTRLWSLRTGSHLCSIEPHIKTKKVHSTLIVDEYRWFVAVFQKNRMYIMEPEN